ncbi:hypothetical protein [Thiomicrorhabdus indica]|uniref:hypothetical protein n=1 Tax=Thiomicrorhabdus indica TaxID=2267253 RepID=UPI00102DF77E|nr:hypothetical protein [Thiomicrorhabdus indica]
MNRFTKDNSRRYFRYPIPCKYFISPELLEASTDLYSNGIDYFNRATEDNILQLKTEVMQKLHRLSAHQDIFLKIVGDIFEKFDIVVHYLRMLNRGEEIASRRIYWQNQERILEGFHGVQELEREAPKTFELLVKIEQKFVRYVQMIQETIENSTSSHLHFTDYPEAFRFTAEIRERFMSRKMDLNKSDLLQMILSLERLFEKGFEPFNNLATDYLLYQKHESWILRDLNLSACGLSFLNTRKYPNLTKADVKLVLENSYAEVIELDGKIVRSRYLRQFNMNETAIDFYFPNANDQRELLAYLHRMEAQATIELWEEDDHARYQ